ncbi:hypothetical protein ACOSP7_030828 [Xanthoceras sorbifolium]
MKIHRRVERVSEAELKQRVSISGFCSLKSDSARLRKREAFSSFVIIYLGFNQFQFVDALCYTSTNSLEKNPLISPLTLSLTQISHCLYICLRSQSTIMKLKVYWDFVFKFLSLTGGGCDFQ